MSVSPQQHPENQPSRQFYETIARYYDAENENMTADLELYLSIAEEHGSPILDVGCGTGRVMFHLAEAGYDVDGIDFSPEMLARGLKRAAHRSDLRDHAFFIEGDAATFAYSKQYAVILIPYNGLMHFHSTAAQIKLIQHLNRFLLPDGVMIFDLPNAGEIFSTGDDSSIMLERTFYEPDHGNFVMQQSVSQLDRTEQMQYITWIYDEIDGNGALKRTVAPLTLRYVFPSELDLLLQVSGMKRVSRFGYYDESPFEEGCERMLVIARKA